MQEYVQLHISTEVAAKSLATGPRMGRRSPLARGVLREPEGSLSALKLAKP